MNTRSKGLPGELLVEDHVDLHGKGEAEHLLPRAEVMLCCFEPDDLGICYRASKPGYDNGGQAQQ